MTRTAGVPMTRTDLVTRTPTMTRTAGCGLNRGDPEMPTLRQYPRKNERPWAPTNVLVLLVV